MDRQVYTTKHPETIRPLFRVTQIVWYLLGIVEALLALRFILMLLDGNASAGFSQFVYGLTNFLAAPFLPVFAPTIIGSTAIEWSTLLAMAVYWLIAWAIVRLAAMSRPVTTIEADRKLEEQDM